MGTVHYQENIGNQTHEVRCRFLSLHLLSLPQMLGGKASEPLPIPLPHW